MPWFPDVALSFWWPPSLDPGHAHHRFVIMIGAAPLTNGADRQWKCGYYCQLLTVSAPYSVGLFLRKYVGMVGGDGACESSMKEG